MTDLKIRDLLRLALPLGTQLRTGVEGLNQSIRNVIGVVLLAMLPVLSGGELVVFEDEPVALYEVMKRMNGEASSALAFIGNIPDDILSAAEVAHIPLLQLPVSVAPDAVVREVSRLLRAPELQIERRAAQLFSEMTGYVARGAGIQGVMQALHTATGQGVALYDASGDLSATWQTNAEHRLLARLDHHSAPAANELADGSIIRAIRHASGPNAPIVYGHIALYGAELDAWDEAAVEQAAEALILELSKQHAIQSIETRAGSDLLDDIVNRLPDKPRQLEEHARELGYDLSRPYVALAIAPANETTSLNAIRERLGQEVQHEHAGSLFVRQGDIILCFYPAGEGSTRPQTLLEAVNRDLAIDAGISDPTSSITSWSTAYSDAEKALKLGRHLFGPRHLTLYADVRLNSLLYDLQSTPDFWTFYHSWLDNLLEYDRQNDASLVQTLESYFDTQGNLSLTAERLNIHRNTLLRRLRRVGELTGINLEHTEDALALQVALQAHRVLLIPEM